jgi:hypothetical protein
MTHFAGGDWGGVAPGRSARCNGAMVFYGVVRLCQAGGFNAAERQPDHFHDVSWIDGRVVTPSNVSMTAMCP